LYIYLANWNTSIINTIMKKFDFNYCKRAL